ncbi:Lamin Tail Domain protein [Calidithermus terrae]|uniref:Lamin Tail Domain protein n=1 Tax=Calidithermus terrae TaxID=1408545 RepID=A0A399E8T8_9DEIN|nr:ExeM/NucH family extracellular endonuclease [Calidithermus terrae]RIH78721.1 Lamin Tail Domain protein [Calidithermus terrae]
MNSARLWLAAGLVAAIAACSQAPKSSALPGGVFPLGGTPVVLSTVPAAGAVGVRPDRPVSVTFDEAMDADPTQTAVSVFPGRYDPASNPASFDRLRLSSVCNGKWRVRNPNPQPISFSWDVFRTPQKGVGVVPAGGEVFFYTSRGMPGTTRIFVGGVQQDVKAAFPGACPPREEQFAWSADSATLSLTPAQPFAEASTYTVALSTLAHSRAGGRLAEPYAWSFTTLRTPQCPAGASVTRTYQIQGSGTASPLAGQTVTTEGVVIGDYQASGQLGGFYIQDFRGDDDPATSDGLFVFNTTFAVNVGDYVQVTGNVKEFASGSDTLTELEAVTSVTVCEGGVSVEPTPVDLPVAAVADLERYEGMLVSFPETLTVTEVFNLARFGEVTLSSDGRQYNPTNGNGLGDSPALNPRRRILLDDASTAQNPATIPYLSGPGPDGTRRVGDTVTGLSGVLTFGFSAYRVQPVGPVSFASANPRPAAPEAVGGSLRVASFNVLNYFTTLGSRGASNPAEFERQKAKLVATVAGLDADVVGLIEMQNNGDTALADFVAALNAALGAGTYAAVQTGTIGTDEIKVALIYKPAKVKPEGAFRVDNDPVHSRPPLAQTFRDLGTGGRFTAVVNHFKSKGSCPSDPSDPNQDYGQGCWNALRVQQAQKLLGFLEQLKATDPDVVLLGDFNAYAAEDPVNTLTAAGLENLVLRTPAPKRYSYVFDGQSGNLDHAFVTASLSPQVTGFTEWHINADEPRAFDYNTEFKPDDRYAPTPYRSSDHDPLLLGLALTADPAAPPDFALSLSDTAPSVQAGQGTRLTVSATALEGFSGDVTLSVGPGVPGVLISSPTNTLSLPGGPTSTTLDVATSASLAPGAYAFTVTGTGGGLTRTASFTLTVTPAPATSCVVISQVYGGGGNSGATLKNDFVELFNCGNTPLDLSSWSVQYASSSGTTWQRTNLTGSVAPGQYYLVQQAAGTGGTVSLPTPDAVGSIAMSATAGKVALVKSQTTLTGSSPLGNPDLADFVGYGGANAFEGSGPTAALSNTTAALRAGNGCQDSNNNAADFSVGAPNPRNTAAPLNPCTP